MTWFLFAGDMLVMLFMAALVVWVFLRMPRKALEEASRVPLGDERPRRESAGGEPLAWEADAGQGGPGGEGNQGSSAGESP